MQINLSNYFNLAPLGTNTHEKILNDYPEINDCGTEIEFVCDAPMYFYSNILEKVLYNRMMNALTTNDFIKNTKIKSKSMHVRSAFGSLVRGLIRKRNKHERSLKLSE